MQKEGTPIRNNIFPGMGFCFVKMLTKERERQ